MPDTAKLEQDYTTLSDRLNQIDSAYQKILPTSQQRIKDIGRGVGENPLNVVLSMLGVGQQAKSAIDSTRTERNDVFKMLSDEMNRKQEQSNSDRDYALKVATSGLKTDEKGNLISGSADSVTNAYVEQVKTGSLKLSSVPADRRDAVVTALTSQGINPTNIDKVNESNKVAGVINQLKTIYEGAGGEDSLSKSRWGGAAQDFINKFDSQMNGRVTRYNELKGGVVSMLKSLVGETGVLTNEDIGRIYNMLPSSKSTQEEAAGKWNDIADLINNKYGLNQSQSNNSGKSFKVGNYNVVVEEE